MSDLYLDFKNLPTVIDFISEIQDYAGAAERTTVSSLLREYEQGKKFHLPELAEAVKRIAVSALPARYAVSRFFEEEGSGEEWERVLASVRPSTAHILKRLDDYLELHALDALLKHEDAEMALKDEDRFEIAEVRKQLRIDYWKTKSQTLAPLVKEGKTLLSGYLKRLDTLRELAADLPSSIDEIYSKLTHYEDRILYEGEPLPLEVLDEEIKYYIEQKEISSVE